MRVDMRQATRPTRKRAGNPLLGASLLVAFSGVAACQMFQAQSPPASANVSEPAPGASSEPPANEALPEPSEPSAASPTPSAVEPAEATPPKPVEPGITSSGGPTPAPLTQPGI